MNNSLFFSAKHILLDTFSSYQHFPNKDQLEGLYDVLHHLSKMAEGQLEDKFFVSSLDPGIGKTKAVTSFLKALSVSDDHKSVGALVGVSTKNEIAAITKGFKSLGVSDHSFAVKVSKSDNAELLALGSGDPPTSQILLTTHQMIAHRSFEVPFNSIGAFHYNSKPRAIRIWDESLLPAQPLCLSIDEIAATLHPLAQKYPNERERLVGLIDQIRKAKDGETVSTLAAFGGFEEGTLLSILRDRNQLPLGTLVTLRALASTRHEEPVVRIDRRNIPYLVGFSTSLPRDLAPLVILDASARLRHTYELWKKSRGNLVSLKSAVKDYSKLKIHVWNKGGGKSSIITNPDRYAAAISDTINLAIDAHWLIVHHKPKADDDFDLKALIGSGLNMPSSGSKPRISYLSWGNHSATNAFNNVDKIILAGTLFYRPIDYEAISNAASGKASLGVVENELIAKTKLGESLHGILQAVCRGSIRNIRQGAPHPCEVYLIAHNGHGIADQLTNVFPGSKTMEWVPEPLKPSGRVLELFTCLHDHFEKHPASEYRFSDLRKTLLMSSQQLGSLRKHSVLRASLREIGVGEYAAKIRANCYRKIPKQIEVTSEI